MPHSVKVTKCACNTLSPVSGSTWKVSAKRKLLLLLLPLLSLGATASKKRLLDPQAPMLSLLTPPYPNHWGSSLEVLVVRSTREGP